MAWLPWSVPGAQAGGSAARAATGTVHPTMSSSDSTWWIAGSPAVAEQPPHRQVRLALGGELGPVARDGRVQVDLAALGQPVGDDRERPFGRGRHQLQGAIGVGRLAVG